MAELRAGSRRMESGIWDLKNRRGAGFGVFRSMAAPAVAVDSVGAGASAAVPSIAMVKLKPFWV